MNGKKLLTLPVKTAHEVLRTVTTVKGADPPAFTEIHHYWVVTVRLRMEIARF